MNPVEPKEYRAQAPWWSRGDRPDQGGVRRTPVKPEGVRSQGGVDGLKGQGGVLAWKFKVEQKGHESQDVAVAR